MPFQKGRAKTGGRVAGTPNKANADIKAAMLEAFERKGGVEYLMRLEDDLFGRLLAKLIPNEITGRIATDMTLIIDRTGRRSDGVAEG